MTPTPGAYLKMRRKAAGLSIADLAAAIATEPRVAEHIRTEWLELIEADVMPATFITIVALRARFPFDLSVLERLVAISLGADLAPPRLCRFCGCSESDACVPNPDRRQNGNCRWIGTNTCSSCAPAAAGFAEPAA